MDLYRFSVNDLVNPFQQGWDQNQQMSNDVALRQAGNALAQSGNYSQPANALFRTGNISAGVQADNIAQQAQQRQQDAQRQALTDHLTFLGKAADYLSQIPDDATHSARRQAVAQIAPTLVQMGYKPQDVQAIQNSDLSDQTLGFFKTQVQKQLEGVNLGNGGFASFDRTNGKLNVLREPTVNLAQGHDLVQMGGEAPPADAIQSGLSKLAAIGATTTSGLRTPQHNADVGGVPDSLHLIDQARDLVPPQGMTTAQLANLARNAIPGAKVIDEGDHVHVQWGANPTVIAQGQPKIATPKWEVLNDAKNGNKAYRYNAATGEATTLDGQPYAPLSAAKISGGGTPRSASALAVKQFIQEHPNATAEDISQFNANVAKERAGTVAFNSGKQAQTITAVNTAINHLGTLGDLATALDNGNIQFLNKAKNAIKTQFGDNAPTDFNGAKQLVAGEIVKAISSAGGGVTDRQEAQDAISSASSPKQLMSLIGRYKQLLGGQLESQRLAYTNATGRSDFDTHLLPQTQAALGGGQSAPAANRPPLSSIFGR